MVKALNGHVATAKRYAEQVVAGKIDACRWVRLACERQLSDLDSQKGSQWKFDPQRAERICKFIEMLPHVKGAWRSKNINLEPWQCFQFTTVFGWIDRETGLRRYRKAYTEIPRKNAKTTGCAGVGLYLLGPDDEPGAEVYSAATTRDQARISWDIAKTMATRTPQMCQAYGIEPLAHSIAIPHDARMFRALSRDADSLEGLNVHGGIIDELHAHKTREVWDVLNMATGSRRQPLIWAITTAGDNRKGVCYEQRNHVTNILSGRHKDDRYFGLIYTLDEEDDWTRPESWAKANPNFGVSVYPDDMETLCMQAQASAESQSTFLTKRLNVWVSAGTAYFNNLAWERRCADPSLKIEDFYGQPCVIAIDVANKSDIAEKLLMFERGPNWYVFGKHYLPEDALERGNPNYDFYRGWARDGHLTITPGNATDYEFIERDVIDDLRNFDVQEIGYDPWNARQLAQRLAAIGAPMAEIPQNVRQLSEPMKEVGIRIVGGRVRHNGDPVLAWGVGNVTAKRDANDNVFPRKDRDENKIDPAVAMISAANRMISKRATASAYSDPNQIAI